MNCKARINAGGHGESWFLKSAALGLVVTGLAKALSAIGPARALDVPDPLFAIPFRHLMLLVGLSELLIAFFCLFTDKRRFSLMAVAWLSTNFLVYRLGLWFIGWHKPCGCLGNLTDMLHISPATADNIMKALLAYLLVGSYATLFWRWRQGRRPAGYPGPERAGRAVHQPVERHDQRRPDAKFSRSLLL